MDFISWIKQPIIWAAIGSLIALFGIVYMIRQDTNKKRADVKKLQPKIKVCGGGLGRDENRFRIDLSLLNYGLTAINLKVWMDGSKANITVDSLKKNIESNVRSAPYKISLDLSLEDDILQKKLDNPKIYISFHDKWFPDKVTYPVISVPLEQVGQPPNPLLKYIVRLDGAKQDPPYEQTFYSQYSGRQIRKIWNQELP